MNSSKLFTPSHRIVRINYCWNAVSTNKELIGVRVTIGIYGNSSSEILLNPFGTLKGSCNTVQFNKNEVVQKIKIVYST